MKQSYGFSALFEALEVNALRERSENTIMDFATGAMEASLLGDDVVSVMGVDDDAIPTGMDDYEDIVDDKMDPSLQKLDAALDDISDDEESLDVLDEALDVCLDLEYEY